MRAAVIPRHGAPDVFRIEDRPVPEPRAGEVLIRVRAAGVNFADVLGRLGLYPDAPKLPYVPGYEVAGIVERAAPDVAGLTEGARVIAITSFNGYSEYVTAPAWRVFPAPPVLSDAEAAGVAVTYLTAAIGLYRMANVSAGETVLIHNAGGGVGIAAAQLAGLRRARLIGTASAAKHAALQRFGFEHLIDYRRASVFDEVTRITAGRGVDVVLDPLGGASFGESYALLAPLGRMVMFGVSRIAPSRTRDYLTIAKTLWAMPRFKAFSLINRNRGVFGLNVGHLWDARDQLAPLVAMLMREFEAGRLAPVVARTFPLEQAAGAHAYLQSRQNIGKVVLTM
ncbi:MAG TPA: zinc-binding dehydrogenase [Vicinamibacterales bacterium]|nr:zinc-binding dehydrogenase [Vicinamibacterales bacterium]